MKKKLKWIGIGFIALLVIIVGLATLGLQDALNLTFQPVDLTKIADGTYTGEYQSGRWSNTVKVVISDHTITAIEPIKIASGRAQLVEELTDRVIAEQQPNVDAIAGATASSKSFLKAVETALINANAQ
jgi:uncharacterized protein with FMN-binding domain